MFCSSVLIWRKQYQALVDRGHSMLSYFKLLSSLTLIICQFGCVLTHGHAYYNNKYALGYTQEDTDNGLWTSTYTYLQTSPSGEICSGCTCDTDLHYVVSCTGSTVYLANLQFPNITAGTFDRSTKEITIKGCSKFVFFEDRTFENLTALETITVQRTALNHVPDLHYSQALKIINLAGNAIKITTGNFWGWNLPSTVTHLALMQNEIYYIPVGWISGASLRIVSFGNNKLRQLQNNVFGTDLRSLKYLGVDGNEIRRVSQKTVAPLVTANLLHFNISNNQLDYVQKDTFSSLPSLRILEVHQNSLKKVSVDTFSNMANLEHLDLHANDIEHLTSRSFENLPNLKELRVHSQKTPMKSIAYDAWSNIDSELKLLFVSSNELPSFPHPVLEQGTYPNLEIIHADNNKITNATGYGEEAFPLSARSVYKQKLATFTRAFTTYPALHTLYLDNNEITDVAKTDYCHMNNLQNLYLGSNLIRETTMDEDAFACALKLGFLDLQSNYIQYVPPSLQNSTMLPAIQTLVLTSNKLTFLKAGTFSQLLTVKYLYLGSNGILAIEDDTFPLQLKSLYLSSNEYRFLHKYPFASLSQLTVLHLDGNKIDYIPPLAFSDCSSLTKLLMNSNNIAQLVKAHFTNCPLTGEVSFGSNDIGWIEPGTFAHLTTIGSLVLENNKLTSLPAEGDFVDLKVTGQLDLASNRIVTLKTHVFKNLEVGLNLILTGNDISIIESEAFTNVAVRSLDLTSNPLRQLNQKSFNGVTLTETLAINGLRFTEIPSLALYDVTAKIVNIEGGGVTDIQSEAFYNLQVETLNLKDNSLGTITANIFGGTSSISQYLYLTNNGLTGISSNAFDNVAINYIYLADNLLEDVPLALQSQNPLRLSLSNNLLKEFKERPFDTMTNLQYLYLSQNKLEEIENGLFDSLTSLQTLDLSDNLIKTIGDKVFHKLASLLYLYLSNNQLTYFNTMPAIGVGLISLISNDIETIGYDAFTYLNNLQYLYLGNNPLGCQCQLVRDLDVVSKVIRSGTCSYPVSANGVKLDISSSRDPMYYQELNATGTGTIDSEVFQCSGEQVVATALSGTDISVAWEQPPMHYFNETVALSPALKGNVTYHVTCDSTTAATLSSTVDDNKAQEGPTNFSVTFDTTAGVVPGTIYECSIKMEKKGFISAKSFPSIIITPDSATGGSNQTAGPDDIELEIKYYDFSKQHPDFQNIEYLTISQPSYIASPYGAWPSVSSTPTADTFSDWYRSVPGTNQEIVDTLILEAQTGTVKRFYSSEFYPVDGKGYMSEFQPDCIGTYHNFGFTSVIRTGLEFAGTEKITVGGGEAVWLYINKILVVEYISDGNLVNNCYFIDLASATSSGDDKIIPEVGTISASGECTGLTPLTDEVTLELEVGEVYHFDLFHAETRMCTSEFLFEVEATTFSQDVSVALPIDYTITIAEDREVGDIVQIVELTDVFSVGAYEITLYKG